MSVRTGKRGKSSYDQKPVRGAAGGLLFLKKISSGSSRKKKGRATPKPGWEHTARGARYK